MVPIPPEHRAAEQKAFSEKLFPHEDLDGQEPYDWREAATLAEAIRLGFIDARVGDGGAVVYGVEEWYGFKHWRALVTGDPEMDAAQPIPDYDYVLREGWKEFRQWSLIWLGRPAVPAPEPLPRYERDAFMTWLRNGDDSVPLPMGWEGAA
jgi:hypothetical protein